VATRIRKLIISTTLRETTGNLAGLHGRVPQRHFFGACKASASTPKLSEFSVIYWGYILIWIDFKGEIGDHVGLIGGLIKKQAKYLDSFNIFGNIFGKRS
jgi:hypothetical protein